ICRRCRTLVQAVGAGVRLPEDPGICPGRRPVEGSHLPLSLPRSLRALARSPPVLSWSVATRRLRADVLPSNLCWLFTPSRMILSVAVTRMRFLALLFVFCFAMVPFAFAIRRRRQPPATTSHAQTAEGLERDVDYLLTRPGELRSSLQRPDRDWTSPRRTCPWHLLMPSEPPLWRQTSTSVGR